MSTKKLARRSITGLGTVTPAEISSLLTDTEQFLQTENSTRPQPPLFSDHVFQVLCWSGRSNHDEPLQSPFDIYTTSLFNLAALRLGAFCPILTPHAIEAASPQSMCDLLLSTDPTLHSAAHHSIKNRLIVARHPQAGIPDQFAELPLAAEAGIRVINGGDGTNENPIEALLFLHMLRVRAKRNSIDGARVLVVGDLGYQAIGRSLLLGLSRLGAEIQVLSPSEIPTGDILNTPGIDCKRADRLQIEKSTLPDVTISLPIRNELFRNGTVPSRDDFLNQYHLSFFTRKFSKDIVFLGHRDDDWTDTTDILNAGPGGVTCWHVNRPTVFDELSVRMAAYKFCFSA